MNLNDKISRRKLLSNLGPGLIMLHPLLRSRMALAQSGGIKRYLLFFTSSGVHQGKFWPQGSGANFSLAGTILDPLAPYANRLSIFKGVKIDSTGSDGHDNGVVIWTTGSTMENREELNRGKYALKESIDHTIQNQLNVDFRLNQQPLSLGVGLSKYRPAMFLSYNKTGFPHRLIQDPNLVFNEMFAEILAGCGVSLQSSGSTKSTQKSVIDVTRAQVEYARKRLPLSKAELDKYSVYLDSIREVEKGLEGLNSMNGALDAKKCQELAAFKNQGMLAVNDQNYPVVAKALLDIVFLAFLLDRTRTINFLWDVGGSPGIPHTWLNVNNSYHPLTHANNLAGMETINRYHAGQFKYLLDKLDSVKEANGKSILDNSFTMWAREFGHGYNHTMSDLPVVIAGSNGGAFSTGKFENLNGRSTSAIMRSAIKSFGMDFGPKLGNRDPGDLVVF